MSVQYSAPETSVSRRSGTAVGPPSVPHLGKLLLGDGAGSHPAAVHPRVGPRATPLPGPPISVSRDPPLAPQCGSAALTSSPRAGSYAPTSCRGAPSLPPPGARGPFADGRVAGNARSLDADPGLSWCGPVFPAQWTSRTLSSFRDCPSTATNARRPPTRWLGTEGSV